MKSSYFKLVIITLLIFVATSISCGNDPDDGSGCACSPSDESFDNTCYGDQCGATSFFSEQWTVFFIMIFGIGANLLEKK